MAGIAIVLDLLRKNPNVYSSKTIHSSALLSAKAAASAAAVTIAAGSPFASRFLYGSHGLPVAYCDAGAAWNEDYISNIRSASKNALLVDAVEYSTKEYNIEMKPLFSAFGLKAFGLTSLRSLLMFYLPLLEPRAKLEDEDDEFLPEPEEDGHVDLVVPFKKSVKQIIRETTVVTIRRVMERLAVQYASQRMAWKLLKDVPKSAMRKAQRGLPTHVYIFSVSRTTFRGHFLGIAASWVVQVGIEIYRFFRSIMKSEVEVDKAEKSKLLSRKIACATVRCSSSLVFASIGAGIGAGIGATLSRPSLGQWLGCAAGDFAGPLIVTLIVESYQLDR